MSSITAPPGAPYGFASSTSAYSKPDPELVKFQLQEIQSLYYELGPREFSSRTLWILRKNPEEGERDILPTNNRFWNRRLVPFLHNRIQKDLDKRIILEDSHRNIMLKPRQAGYTTWSIAMRLFLPAVLNPGVGCMLMSQNSEYAAAHFDILKRFWRYFFVADPFDSGHPDNDWANSLRRNLLHVVYSNRRELVFDQLDSRVRCASAEVEESGQGLTIQNLVCTELSRWEGNPEETMANVKEAIPTDGTLDIECTPNGAGGYFFEEWGRATNPGNKKREFKPHFHTWWWHDEYRREPGILVENWTEDERNLIAEIKDVGFPADGRQIAWRREKKESLRHNFDEKYPENPTICFLVSGNMFFEKTTLSQRYQELITYEPAQVFNKFVVFNKPIKHRNYIIGADPATGMAVTSDDPDYSAAVVIDRETGEEMAAYRAHVLPEEFANDLVDLARMFNSAELIIERFGEGGTVITSVVNINRYGNVYVHLDWHKRLASKKGLNTKEFLGFPTTTRTRPMALNRARDFFVKCPDLIWDKQYLAEALTFCYNDKGKPEAIKGTHDDAVLCRGFAYFLRELRNGGLVLESVRKRERYGATPTEYQEPEEKE